MYYFGALKYTIFIASRIALVSYLLGVMAGIWENWQSLKIIFINPIVFMFIVMILALIPLFCFWVSIKIYESYFPFNTMKQTQKRLHQAAAFSSFMLTPIILFIDYSSYFSLYNSTHFFNSLLYGCLPIFILLQLLVFWENKRGKYLKNVSFQSDVPQEIHSLIQEIGENKSKDE